MITVIALKEFYGNLISSRFLFSFLLCLFLVPFSLLVSISDYQSQIRAYEADRKAAEMENTSIRVYSALRPALVRPPEPLSIFSRGIRSDIGGRIKILLGERPFMTTGKSLERENPFMNAFSSLDFINIIAIAMSLLAILFSYNLCSFEREAGTLKLMLANPVARWKILLGKAIGTVLTLLPVILFCFILCAIIVRLAPGIMLSRGDWVRIVLLLGLGIVYMLIFMMMGILISTHAKSSATSIAVGLFSWVLFLFVIPNFAGYAADGLIKLESRDSLDIGINELNREFDGKVEAYRKDIWREMRLDPSDFFGQAFLSGADGYREWGGQSPELMESQRRVHMYSEPLRIEYAGKKWVLQKGYLDRLDFQRKWTEWLSLFSPSEVFRLSAASLCRTDVLSHYRFLEAVSRYRELIISFFADRKMFSSYLYFTRQAPETFMPSENYVSLKTGGRVKTVKEYFDLLWSPGFDRSTLNSFEIPGADPLAYSPLDLSNVPRFHMKGLTVGQELNKIMNKLSAMIITVIVLFYLSYISFIRYDVR